MKSTGEAIGYDEQPDPRALQGPAGLGHERVPNYGTIFVTIADSDKEEALPLIRRFYNLGFNIEATQRHRRVPARANGIRTRVRKKLSEGSEEILDSIRQGHVSYVINTRDMQLLGQRQRRLRRFAAARWKTM